MRHSSNGGWPIIVATPENKKRAANNLQRVVGKNSYLPFVDPAAGVAAGVVTGAVGGVVVGCADMAEGAVAGAVPCIAFC